MNAVVKNIEAKVHGRFLFEEGGGKGLLAGFHGYAETADAHMSELQKIAGIDDWSLLSIQALHPFYTRAGEIVACWMTSQDRELAIADNISYVRSVIESVPHPRPLVFLGFSQGAAMAARPAAFGVPSAGLILLGGDIPPDVKDARVNLPPVLLARGERDDWYTEEKFKEDLRYLEMTTKVVSLVFEGGHEWADVFRDAASSFLRTMNDEP